LNRVIIDIAMIRYLSISKYKVISIDLITQFHERVITNIGIIRHISNSKYKVTSIDLITRIHELRDYEYRNYKIYF